MLEAELALHWGNQQILPAAFSFAPHFEGIQSMTWFWLHALGKNTDMKRKKSYKHTLLLRICGSTASFVDTSKYIINADTIFRGHIFKMLKNFSIHWSSVKLLPLAN